VVAFTGREVELAELDLVLARADAAVADPQASKAVAGVVLSGPAGIGKTSLAVHWAHRVRGRFHDGQLYVNLRGHDPDGQALEPVTAVRQLLNALGVSSDAVPANLDAAVGWYRSLLVGKRVLVVLDNARDAGQVRSLVPGASGCMVVVTSRNELPGLVAVDGALPLTLDLFSAAEAGRMLAGRLGAERVAAEATAVDAIIAQCAGLPLALAVVVGRVVSRPRLALAEVAAELCDTGGLGALSGGDDPRSDVRATFSWSVRALDGEAARMFRLLAVHPGPDVAAPAVASLSGIPPRLVRALLAKLTGAHLVTEHVSGRFVLHDLLRAYAAEEAAGHDAERRAALHRLLDHYVHTVLTARRVIAPQRRSPTTPTTPRPGVYPEQLTDLPAAVTWFHQEHAAVVALIPRAAEAGFDRHASQLAAAFFTFFRRHGLWHEGIVTQQAALSAVRRLGDEREQAYVLHRLGLIHAQLGRGAEAGDHQYRALELFTRLDDRIGMAATHLSLHTAAERPAEHAEQADHATRALHLYREAGDRMGQADALSAVGREHVDRGDIDAALLTCRQALALHSEADDRFGQAGDLTGLGEAYRRLGSHREATRCYEAAARLHRELGVHYDEAISLVALGDAQHAGGDPAAARETWHQALTILDQLSHPGAADVRAKLLQSQTPAGRPR
jgi:tetratricopeptide (TPR) repeat protein